MYNHEWAMPSEMKISDKYDLKEKNFNSKQTMPSCTTKS